MISVKSVAVMLNIRLIAETCIVYGDGDRTGMMPYTVAEPTRSVWSNALFMAPAMMQMNANTIEAMNAARVGLLRWKRAGSKCCMKG